jgi:hypothetical protein
MREIIVQATLERFFISFLIRIVKFTTPVAATEGRIEFTFPPSQLTLRREFEITSKVETRLKAILQGRSRIIRFRHDRE